MAHLSTQALLLHLLERMKEKGSWSGETHLQKAVYVAQEVLGVPFGFDFILYKHGPFSFDLRDALAEMQADRFIGQVFQAYPYGPTLKPDANAPALKDRFPKTIATHRSKIDFVADALSPYRAAELEGLATAIYVTRKSGTNDRRQRANALRAAKPHIDVQDAQRFVELADDLLSKAEQER